MCFSRLGSLKRGFFRGLGHSIATTLCLIPGARLGGVELSDAMVIVRGEIQMGDAATLEEVLSRDHSVLTIFLDSEGGDVSEAEKMGRALRGYSNHIGTAPTAVVKVCFSSCVLILAGAKVRMTAFGKTGLHRPYLARGEQSGDIAIAYRAMTEELRAYFLEMNLSSGLADRMFATPPGDIDLLSEIEAARLFPERDPVYDEELFATGAKRFGVSSAELRARAASAEAECKPPVGLDETNWKDHVECSEAEMWGLSLNEYQRRKKVSEHCFFETYDVVMKTGECR